MSRSIRRAASEHAGWGPWAVRRRILLGGFLLSGVLILGKAVELQIFEHERWSAAAEDQHRERVELPARRGAIYDRKGVPLALSHEVYQISIAPHELHDRSADAEAIATILGRPTAEVRRAMESSRSWVVLPGRYSAEQRRALGSRRGVYFERQYERFYPQGDIGREVIGAVTLDGRALGGIEQEFDEWLRGEPGYSILRRDARGDAQAALSLPVVPPVEGASIHLTIDSDLQAIADAALRDAMQQTGARGGDLMIADPRTGELLASVSRRPGRSRTITAITEPFEPGSTLKPFLAAALLAENRATLADTVFAEDGYWRDGNRVFRDTSPHEWLSLREALQVSSNIAVVKFATRLSSGQQYAYLRDFGFGTLTGIEYPAESAGLLRRPREWSRLSSASLAMGYELAATPLQLVGAYGALANGGLLMEPMLVREIRAPGGRTLLRTSPQELRRVVPEEVARALTEVLVSVVEEGTATRASLETFAVAGKTGTSRRTAGGGYEPGAYTSTFAGYFPAQDPQIVLFVKLDEPEGEYYGGVTAAPVTRETLHAILASRTPGLDPRSLLATRAERSARPTAEAVTPAQPPRNVGRAEPLPNRDGTFVFLVADGLPSPALPETSQERIIPELEGFTLREGAQRLHSAGAHVRIEGSGRVVATDPAAGSTLLPGDTVILLGKDR